MAIVLALACSALRSQDCIDAHGRPCSAQDSRRLRAVTCKTEVVSPNLFLAAPTTVSGFLLDQTGAPFAIGEQTIVEVRDPKKSKALYSAPVNLRGRFDLGLVKAGTFRLIVAIKVHGGVLERPPGFDQPARMDCSGDGECNIRPIVRADHSEDSLASCPPK
ncbi:MAG TPA: hypothetical protein VKB38_03030 [Terracidiphilus sp.]|nr:hypothetical protein [Terracidiphilus sp.]